MNSKRWTWRTSEQPKIIKLIESSSYKSDWCDDLESAEGCTTGKVLSVCAAVSIVREAIATSSNLNVTEEDKKALDLLETWIDEPSKQNFDKICDLLFEQDEESETFVNLTEPIWCALRCSTSHPDGCGEIAWALEGFCDSMEELGFTKEWLQVSGLKGVRERMESDA